MSELDAALAEARRRILAQVRAPAKSTGNEHLDQAIAAEDQASQDQKLYEQGQRAGEQQLRQQAAQARQQQRDADKAARELAKANKDAAAAAQRERNNQLEAQYRRAGREHYVDADGNIQATFPDEEHNRRIDAELAKKAEADQRAKDAEARRLRAVEINTAQYALQRQEQTFSRQQQQLDLEDNALRISQREADNAIAAHKAKENSAADYDAWSAELGRLQATKADLDAKSIDVARRKQTVGASRLKWEEQTDPQRQALTGEEITLPIATAQELTADRVETVPAGTQQPAEPPTAPAPPPADPSATLTARAMAAETRPDLPLEQRQDAADLIRLRRDNPAAWLQALAADREALPFEELDQQVRAQVASFQQRQATVQAAGAKLQQQQQAVLAPIQNLMKRNAALLAGGYTDANTVTLYDEAGRVQRLHKDLVPEYNQLVQIGQQKQQASAAEIAKYEAERAELEQEQVAVQQALNDLRRRHQQRQTEASQARKTELQSIEQRAGKPGLAADLEKLDEQERQRLASVNMDSPAGQQAAREIQADVAKQRDAQLPENMRRSAAADAYRRQPGMAPIADRLEQAQAKADKRRQEIEQRTADPVQRRLALQSLEDENKRELDSIQKEAAERQEAGAKLYNEWGADLNVVDWTSEDIGPRLRQEAEARGFTEAEARQLLDLHRKADWSRPLSGPEAQGDRADGITLLGRSVAAIASDSDDWSSLVEPVRTLPNGVLTVNPGLYGSEKAYMAAVQAAPASPAAKEAARAAFPELQQKWAATVLPILQQEMNIPGLPSFNAWAAEKKADPAFAAKPEAQQALDYIAEVRSRGTAHKYLEIITRRLGSGLIQLGAAAVGILGMTTPPSAVMSESAAWLNRQATAVGGATGSKGLGDDVWQRSTGLLAELTPQIAAQIGTGALGGGLKTAAVVAAGQTAGMQYASTYDQLRQQGKTHLQAWAQSAPGALASGIVTGMLTRLGGNTGPEALLRTLQGEAGKKALREALNTGWKSTWSKAASLAKHAGGEVAEELPDELFSQLSEVVSLKGENLQMADLIGTIDQFVRSAPELMIAVGAMGGSAGAVRDAADRATVRNILRPEQLRQAAAEIDNVQIPGVDPQETAAAQRRATVALALADGSELQDISEADLNAAGWTRLNKDGQQDAAGTLTALKGYTGPSILEVRSDGKVRLNREYVTRLREYMPTVAEAIPPRLFDWHTPTPSTTEKPSAATPSQPKAPLPGTVPAPQVAATAPAAGSPSAGGSQAGQPVTPPANAPAIQPQPGPVGSPAGNAPQPSAQATAGAGIQPASGQPNPGQTGPTVAAPDSIEAAAANLPGDLPTDDPRVQRAWEIANHLEAAGMERTAANKIAAETLRRQGVNSRDVNVQVTAPQFATLLDELGVTGDRRSQEGTPPLTAPADLDSRLSRVAQPAATSQPPAPSAARPLPAPSGITPQAGAAPAVSGTGSAEGAASAPPAGAAPATTPAEPSSKTSTVDLSDILTKWRNREATDADVVRAAMERSGSTNSKDLVDILIEAAGWYPQRAKLAVAAVLTKQGGVDLTDPGLAGDSIPLGAARREGTQLGTVSTPGTAAAPSPNADSASRNLGTQAAWSRARTFALARIKDPKRRAWARKAISATEAEIAANSGLFDALIVGPLARAMNSGAAFSVERTPQGIALVTDLDAVLAQMAYIGNPTAAIRATMAEEAIHGAQKRLEQAKPDRWSPGKLASLWRDLPEAVRQKAWQAYNAQSVSGAPDVPGRNYAGWMQWRQGQMPAEMSDAEAYQMASEFLRMLVQDSIDPNSVTESVDPNPSLVARIKALLADLYNVLRGLIKGLPPQQATDLDGMVSELRTALERGRTASSPARTAKLQFLRDSKAVAYQAMRTGALYTELAKGDRLFTDDGLRSIWGRLTPELQRAVFALRAREQVGLTGQRSRADKAELMRDLLAILTHPDAGPELAQTLLENTPHAVAANNILRRALNAVRRYFAGTPTQSLLEALKRAPVEDLQLLRQLRAQTTYAWAQFEATAQVQQTQEPVPAAPAAAVVNAPDSGDDDRRRKAAAEALARQMAQDEQRRVLQRAAAILEQTLGRPAGAPEPAGPPAPIDTAIKSAEESANAMVEAWMQRQALEQIADPAERARALAKFDREQRLDPATQQQRWDSMDEAQQALEAALAENSTPAAAQALKRRLAHQAYVARRMLEFALQELGALPSYEQTVPAALLRVGRGEISLGTVQNRRTLSRSSPESAPVRMMGTAAEGALNALGIEIHDDGTLYTSSPDTPVYVERNQIIIRQSTLDSISEDLPMLRRMLPESEAAQRRALGLPRTPAGTTIDDIVASRMEAARERTRRQQNMRIRNLERTMGLGEFSGELTGPLLDPAELAGPMRGGGTDIISWLPNNHGSLGWPAENSGGEWDWFRDLLREYYSPTTLGRTELRQRYRAGKVIGSELVTVGLGTKLGMTNTAKKMASLGNLSTPAALVEWLIDKGIVTPPDPTEKVRSTDLLENQAAAGDITTAETAALDDNIPIPEGIGNAVMAAIEARIKARAAAAVRPEAVGELQALRFERDAGLNLDSLKGKGSIEAGKIWRQAQDAPSVFITLRRRDGSHEQTPLTYVDEAWYSVEESEFQEGSPYFRRDRNGYPEQLWVILDGGTYYGRNQIPATATLQYGTPGNTDLNAMDEAALAAMPVTNEEYQEAAPPATAAAPQAAPAPSAPAAQTEPIPPAAPSVPETPQVDKFADIEINDGALALIEELQADGLGLKASERSPEESVQARIQKWQGYKLKVDKLAENFVVHTPSPHTFQRFAAFVRKLSQAAGTREFWQAIQPLLEPSWTTVARILDLPELDTRGYAQTLEDFAWPEQPQLPASAAIPERTQVDRPQLTPTESAQIARDLDADRRAADEWQNEMESKLPPNLRGPDQAEEYLAQDADDYLDKIESGRGGENQTDESTPPSDTSTNVEEAASLTDTEPTEAQKEAGNYRKGKVTLHGLTISIENPRGSERTGTDANGKAWSVTMPHHYGYILGTVGKDKDHIDAFIGPDPTIDTVYVVNQRKPGNGHFDEHKVMLGFPSAGAAARGYLDSYSAGWRGYQSMVAMDLEQFRAWLTEADKSQPVTRPVKQVSEAANSKVETVEAPPKPKNSTRTAAGSGRKIEDFGEKIGGARKDVWGAVGAKLQADLPDNARDITLSKHWPEPDYEKLIAQGADASAMAAFKALRDIIPSKPQASWKLRQWAEVVRTGHKQMQEMLANGGKLTEHQKKVFADSKEISLLVRLYQNLGFPTALNAKGWTMRVANYSVFSSVTVPQGSVVLEVLKNGRFVRRGDGAIIHRILSLDEQGQLKKLDQAEQELAEEVRVHIAAEPKPPAASQTTKPDALKNYGIWVDRFTNEAFVGRRGINGVVRLKSGFPTAKEAHAWRLDNLAELEATWESLKIPPDYRTPINTARQGPNRRDGDMTPELFQDTFGFRGVEFGNWVENDRRQQDLNQSFDALMDLAAALGVSPKALSLDGSLGLAFGARGLGGKTAASAHYEPGLVVMNFTKKGGPGSLAHEWWHAFDNYFARLDKTGETQARPLDAWATTRQLQATGHMRPIIGEAFRKISEALNESTPFGQRSKALDDARSKPYYGTMVEKSARAFERYVRDRLAAQMISSDYLVNIRKDASPALPTEDEMAAGIQAAYDDLFTALESKTTERGVMLFAAPRVPTNLPNVILGGELGTLTSLPDYAAAKAGDTDAAYRVSRTVVTLDLLERIRESIGDSKPIVVPVLALEKSGANKIPQAAASAISHALALKLENHIIQDRRVGRSQATGLDRIFLPVPFDGPVQEGHDYLLVDDTLTQGGTFAGLASHIIAGGGRVKAIVALTGKQYSAILTPSDEILAALRKLHGDLESAFREAVGYEFDSLTHSEARYLANFRPIDAIRARILAERNAQIARPLGGTTDDGATLKAANRIAAASFNHIDRAMSSAVGRMATTAASTEPAAALANTVAAWYRQDRPDANLLRATKELVQKELLPETVLPREVTAAMREMNMRIALGQQKALDVTRAMSGTPKFSDLAYPEEFVENPMHREQLFDAMEGRLDMASLPPAIQAVGKRLRAMLAEAGREAVAAGRMSPDTFEGLRTTYMPRYTREDAEANSADLAGFLKRFKLGVHDVLAQRSTAFHIVDTTRKDKAGQAAIVSPPGRSWRFPSQQALDAYYEELIERETLTAEPDWMTRADKKLHRSLTAGHLKAPASMSKDQVALVRRIQLGLRNQYRKEKPYTPKDLIRDPIYAVTRYLAESAQDNATAEFFRLVADNPKWVSDVELKGFKQIPDSPRFGALAGKWVQGDIASQVTEMAEASNQALRLYESLLRLWKAGKTVLNPATHGRNLIGNVPFSMFAGTNVLNPANAGYYWQAFSLLRQGGPQLVELYEAGVLGADYGTVELRTALEGIVPPPPASDDTDVMKQLIALGNRAAAWAKVRSVPAALIGATAGAAVGAAAGGLPGAAVGAVIGAFSGPIYRAATLAYRLEDEVFKIAAFLKAKDMGMTAEQAADHVRAWFPFYDKATSTTIKAATLTVMPFSSFYRESARICGAAAKERPLALASTIAIPSIITAVSTALLGLSKEDEDEVRKDMRGKGAKLLGATPLAGTPLFSMLLPIRTADGSLVQMDLTSTHPFADFLSDRVENTQNMPWWQTWSRSLLTNPMLGLLYTASTGKDPFGDRTLWDSSYTDAEKAAALFGHAWKTAVPPLTPGGTNWQMLENAGRRQANKTLAIRNPMQSIARALVGLDFRSADPNIYRLADEFRQARNLSAAYDGAQAFPTDAAGRARKAIFEELVQPQPDADKLTELLQRLNDLGTPVRSVKDVLKILDRRRPDAVINPKELRAPFRAAQAPEAKRVLDTALQEFARARSATPAAFAEARKRLNASTRPTTD